MQISNGIQNCTDREGNIIESKYHGVESNSIKGQSMNCECAMARKYLSPLSHKPTCCDNGN